MTDAQDQTPQWVVRLRPLRGSNIEQLLQMSLGLDVWERKRDPDMLVVAANESQINELVRRRLASVERLYTVEQYLSESGFAARDKPDAKDAEESNEEDSQE
jgi:hypothetical protein